MIVKKANETKNTSSRISSRIDTHMHTYLEDVFKNHLTAKTHIDTKINWLLGISGLIMTVTLPYIISGNSQFNHFGIFVISITAFSAFLVGLINLDLPPIFTRHKPEQPNLMFYKAASYKNSEELYEELKKINTDEAILRQYSNVIYNLVERNLGIKNKLFKLSRDMLFVGLVAGFTIIIVSMFIM